LNWDVDIGCDTPENVQRVTNENLRHVFEEDAMRETKISEAFNCAAAVQQLLDSEEFPVVHFFSVTCASCHSNMILFMPFRDTNRSPIVQRRIPDQLHSNTLT